MGFLNHHSRFLQGGARAEKRLVPQEDPIPLDERHSKGAWVVTKDGSIERVLDGEWTPLYPRGAEVTISPWSPVPPGWTEVMQLGPDWSNARVITNAPQGTI